MGIPPTQNTQKLDLDKKQKRGIHMTNRLQSHKNTQKWKNAKVTIHGPIFTKSDDFNTHWNTEMNNKAHKTVEFIFVLPPYIKIVIQN